VLNVANVHIILALKIEKGEKFTGRRSLLLLLAYDLSFTNGVSGVKVVKWKVSKRA
jgi:hypothetical protein